MPDQEKEENQQRIVQQDQKINPVPGCSVLTTLFVHEMTVLLLSVIEFVMI